MTDGEGAVESKVPIPEMAYAKRAINDSALGSRNARQAVRRMTMQTQTEDCQGSRFGY
jgi:hypothetical protein